MRAIYFTEKNGVMTTRGFIPYLEHPSGKFLMAIKVKPDLGRGSGKPRPPVITAGFLVFALPGGGSYISPYRLDQIVSRVTSEA